VDTETLNLSPDDLAQVISDNLDPLRPTGVSVDNVGSFAGHENRHSMAVCKVLESPEGQKALAWHSITLERHLYRSGGYGDPPFPILLFIRKDPTP
jgi:hypothetical protein